MASQPASQPPTENGHVDESAAATTAPRHHCCQ